MLQARANIRGRAYFGDQHKLTTHKKKNAKHLNTFREYNVLRERASRAKSSRILVYTCTVVNV